MGMTYRLCSCGGNNPSCFKCWGTGVIERYEPPTRAELDAEDVSVRARYDASVIADRARVEAMRNEANFRARRQELLSLLTKLESVNDAIEEPPFDNQRGGLAGADPQVEIQAIPFLPARESRFNDRSCDQPGTEKSAGAAGIGSGLKHLSPVTDTHHIANKGFKRLIRWIFSRPFNE